MVKAREADLILAEVGRDPRMVSMIEDLVNKNLAQVGSMIGKDKSHSVAIRTWWRIPAQKVAVLPVPDWACWITSRPLVKGTIPRCWIAEGFSKPNT